jgi:hypothetical protein
MEGRMKITVLALGFVLVLFLVANAAGWIGTEGNNMLPAVPASINSGGSSPQSAATPPQPADPYVLVKTPTPTAAEPELPIYPGAIVTKDVRRNNPPRFIHLVHWKASGSYDSILAFYREKLAEQGWRRLIFPVQSRVETAEDSTETITFNPNTDPYFGLTYYWTDDTGRADYRLRLGLLIVQREDGGQEVRAAVHRVPDENKIPLYIDAEEIEVSGDSKERVISYLSNSPTSSLVDFYDNLAPEYGWTAWRAEQNVVRLGYNEETMEYGLGPWLYGVVMMHEEMQNKTKVEIHLTGLDSFTRLQENP